MTSLIIRIVVNAASLFVAAKLLPGISLGGGDTLHAVINVLGVGAILTLINAAIRPIVATLSFAFYVVTLGLFGFVVTALMLKIASWLSGMVGLDFDSGDFFWTTILAAIIVTLVSTALNIVLPDGKQKNA